MKQDEALQLFFKLLEKAGLSVDLRQKEQVVAYLNLLSEWGRRINLVSGGDLENLLERHIYPSALFALIIKMENTPDRILDFGSGAGLPGVLLAILLKETELTLLDSNRKKCLFLRQVRKDLVLSFSVVNERMEQWTIPAGRRFPVITARAVAPLSELIEYVRPVIPFPGYLLTVKGPDYMKELGQHIPGSGIRIVKRDIPKEWIEFNPYLKNKYFVKMEFVNA